MKLEHSTLFYIIIAIIVIEAVWDFVLDLLNRSSWANEVPSELKDVYPEEKLTEQKSYRLINYHFNWITSSFSLLIILSLLWLNGFAWLDELTATISSHWLLHPLLFFGTIGLGSTLISLPFSIYKTFVVEQKFGFNKSTPALFTADLFKSMLVGAIIGGSLLALVIWFYQWAGELFWLYAWGAIAFFMIFFSKFYTHLILPIFNKLKPLEDGELRSAIESMSLKTGFSLENIFVMDGSKRSTKSNAFFSGFGKSKKIVLYDTLIEELSTQEIVAVLAHEIGHNKLNHTIWVTILGVLQSGFMLFLLGWFVNHPAISLALGVSEPSFHIGLLGFGLLYAPMSILLGLGMTVLSRKHEYQADAFAANYSNAFDLQSALKKISASSLSNPTPHPWYVFFYYSHPPLLNRIKALDKLG